MRQNILKSSHFSGGHISTSLSCVEILVALYFGSPQRLSQETITTGDPDRDIFIMSKGHGENALYSLLVETNCIPQDWLDNHYRSGDFRLGGHVDSSVPGVEFSTGALGHGCCVANGFALAKKKRQAGGQVFCLVGDAECSEGSFWEALIFASNNQLTNLTFLIDNNKIGSLDFTKNYVNFDRQKTCAAFDIETLQIDGHSLAELDNALSQKVDGVKVIVCDTIKGKGISLVENDPIWHVKKVDNEVYNIGKKELEQKNANA